MTRTGKIARLPQDVREELNRRLLNGEKGRKLIAWLNQHPETISVLAENFGGRKINEVNLSDWKKGGYVEWVGRKDLVENVVELSANAEGLAAVTKGRMTENLSAIVALRYAALLTTGEDEASEEFRRKLRALQPLCDSVLALRRGDHNSMRMGLEAAEARRVWEANQKGMGMHGETRNGVGRKNLR